VTFVHKKEQLCLIVYSDSYYYDKCFFVIKFTYSFTLKIGINLDNAIILSSTLQKTQPVFITMTVSDIYRSNAYIL
jgi:hypothetical protein